MLGRLTPMIAGALPNGSWAPMVAERLFGWSSHPRGSSYPQRGQPASRPPQTHSGAHPWHQHSHGAAGSSGAMADADSTEVVDKIRQWSLPGAAVVPVLNVSSRVFWLELDDKALLDSYTVLQEGILCDVLSQKCSQGARGERLTYGCHHAAGPSRCGWLAQFHVVAKEPMAHFYNAGYSHRGSICGWRSSCGGVCLLTECTLRPRLGSRKKNSMLCFLTGLPGAATRIRMKKKLIVDLQSKKSKHGGCNAKSGCHTSKVKVRRWSSTSRAF